MANLETFEYSPQTETYETGWGAETEWGGEAEVFSEAETMELAGELTEITTEAELDRFLGDLISKAGRALGKVVRSPIGTSGGWMVERGRKIGAASRWGGSGWLSRRTARSQNRQRARFGRWQRAGPGSRDEPRRS